MKRIIPLLLMISFFSIASKAQEEDKFRSSLKHQWDINDSISNKSGLGTIRPYKPAYILMANYSNNPNLKPKSGAFPDNLTSENIDATELKFQFSFKAKIINNIFGKWLGGDIWMAYTQSSRWQVYNSEVSRPFRETNYEPEAMLIFPTRYKILGIEGAFIGVGVNHQSNGRSEPLSRSWNRVIAQIAWETKNSSLTLRPWWRIQEDSKLDDNPDIEDYLGRMELWYNLNLNRHNFSLILRHPLEKKIYDITSVQFDYAYTLWDKLKLHAQLFHGYGESMIDYNHKQTTVGIGFSLTN